MNEHDTRPQVSIASRVINALLSLCKNELYCECTASLRQTKNSDIKQFIKVNLDMRKMNDLQFLFILFCHCFKEMILRLLMLVIVKIINLDLSFSQSTIQYSSISIFR